MAVISHTSRPWKVYVSPAPNAPACCTIIWEGKKALLYLPSWEFHPDGDTPPPEVMGWVRNIAQDVYAAWQGMQPIDSFNISEENF